MQRFLIVVGVVLVVVGLLWPWLAKWPFGRLPGDIHFHRAGFDFYFPITSGLLVSILVSLLIWFFRR